jgi:hypothetical protein
VRRGAFIAALLAILGLGLVLRLAAIGNDAPADVERTNAPAQDAFWYLEAALAPADGSALEPLVSYDRPLWTAIARPWFAAFGTSVASAHALGATLGALAVLFLGVALRPLGARRALLGALLLATAYPFVGLARTPLIYTPVATLLTLAWALHANAGAAGKAAAWALAIAVTLSFKGVAVVILPGFALAALAKRPGRSVLISGAVLALAAVLLVREDPLGTIARNSERIHRYLGGDLAGREAPLALARRILLVAWSSGLVALAPGLLGLAAIGGVSLARRSVPGREVLLTAAGWAGALFSVLALLDYRPLRFFALAAPPLAALGAQGAVWLFEAPTPGRGRAGVAAHALDRAPPPPPEGGRAGVGAALALALAGAFAAANALGLLTLPALLVAPLAVGAGAILLFLTLRGWRPPLAGERRVLAVALVVSTIGLDLARDVAALGEPRTLERAAAAVQAALGPGAVLAGPQASLLAAGAHGLERRRGAAITGGPFAREGIAACASAGYTHLALDVDQDEHGGFATGFAREGSPPILLLELAVRSPEPGRREHVRLYRLANAAGYALSPFEEACRRGDARALAGAPRDLVIGRARALLALGRKAESKALAGSLPADDPERRNFLAETGGAPTR